MRRITVEEPDEQRHLRQELAREKAARRILEVRVDELLADAKKRELGDAVLRLAAKVL